MTDSRNQRPQRLVLFPVVSIATQDAFILGQCAHSPAWADDKSFQVYAFTQATRRGIVFG